MLDSTISTTKTHGEHRVAALWVESSDALKDICQRVRAYPAAFLEKHPGPVI